MSRVLATFDAYLAEAPFRQTGGGFRPGDLVAYFCAEFGVNESLPTYSGGLGILAGDQLQGGERIQCPHRRGLLIGRDTSCRPSTARGRQRAAYHDSDFDDLPIDAVKRDDGPS